MDRSKLAKILSLTQSENDHEALSASRMANSLLKKENLTWGQVLGSDAAKPSGSKQSDRDIYEDMFRAAQEEINRAARREADRHSQSVGPVEQKIKDIMSRGTKTDKLQNILRKVQSGQEPTQHEIQYVETIHAIMTGKWY